MRKGELILNYVAMFGPLVLGLGVVWATLLATRMLRLTLLLMGSLFIVGFIFFVKAKFSAIKEGRLFSFGPSRMSRPNRIAYFLGYGGMGLGVLLVTGLALVRG